MTLNLLTKEDTCLILVDAQVKLMPVMRRGQEVVTNIKKLLALLRYCNLPLLLTEQYPRMLGSTIPEIKEDLPAYDPIKKMEFNCCAVRQFNERLGKVRMKNIVLAGVETHICILQTCCTLLAEGYSVHVPQDAVDSRSEENWHVGLELMRKAGAVITSSETVIYQLLQKAGTPEFKGMLRIVK